MHPITMTVRSVEKYLNQLGRCITTHGDIWAVSLFIDRLDRIDKNNSSPPLSNPPRQLFGS